MGTAIIIIVLIALACVAAYTTVQRHRADQEEGVVLRIGDWRLTPRELIVGNKNETAERHALVNLEASFDMSGNINRDSGRYTVTRFALLGPLALAAKKDRNKKLDDREGYLTVVGPQTALLKTVKGPQFSTAQKFVLEFNKFVRLNESQMES